MNLEEIINAAVEKRLSDMLLSATGGKEYQSVESFIRSEFNKQMLVALKAREAEIKELISKAVLNFNINSFEISAYTKVQGREV